MAKKVSIVIPNWNGKVYLNDCLRSLCEIDYKNFIVVVVDNGSSDGSVEFLQKKFPQVVVIQNQNNLGFAAGCNVGIRYSLKKYVDFVLLLNNDTVVSSDFLSKMMKTAEDERVGIIGCKIFYHDNPEMIWAAGGNYIPWRVSGKFLHWKEQNRDSLNGELDCSFVNGCVMLIGKEVFKEIGLFFEPYFLTVEDLDFCYQAKLKGWKIRVNLDAEVWHKISFSRGGEFSFSDGYYGTRNRLWFAFKRSENYLGGIIFLLFIVPVRFIQWTILGNRDILKGMKIGVKDFFSGTTGKNIKYNSSRH